MRIVHGNLLSVRANAAVLHVGVHGDSQLKRVAYESTIATEADERTCKILSGEPSMPGGM